MLMNMLILGELDAGALGALVGQVVIVAVVALFLGRAFWRALSSQKQAPPPPLPRQTR